MSHDALEIELVKDNGMTERSHFTTFACNREEVDRH